MPLRARPMMLATLITAISVSTAPPNQAIARLRL
jgi:hypothetical protein